MTREELWVCHLGTVPYRDAVALQERVRARVQTAELPDTLLLLEHPPVYTRGRRSSPGELGSHGPGDLAAAPDGLAGADFPRARGDIDVVDTDRGGRVTYHGPGQLVGYPIMAAPDVIAHLRTIESAIVAALAAEGVTARSRHDEGIDYTGVWVGPRKIASIGVHVSRGVSTHGFAVNVDLDLAPFSWVVACGLPDVTMTSVAQELPHGRGADMDRCRTRMADHFCQAHGRYQRLVSPQRLGIDTPLPLTRGGMPRANSPRTSSPCADATPKNTIPIPPSLVTCHGVAV